MWNLDYESVKEISALMESHGYAMSKKFGQNFLLPEYIREKIVSGMGDISGKAVWEVGPGFGSITSVMLKKGADLTCFEIDHGFAEILRTEAFADEPNFRLVEGDALKTLFQQEGKPDVVCGNLPYNVGSVIIASLIENGILPDVMVYTLQKEVVDRMCSKENRDDYSSFSVLTQFDYENKLSFVIGRGNFWPEPKVDSAVVVMKKRTGKFLPDEERKEFFLLVRALFAQRRKTVRNNLLQICPKEKVDEVLAGAGLTGKERAETLSRDKMLELYQSRKRVLA